MSRLAGRARRPRGGARFALTLVPIAIGYHVAHYLVFLLVQGQYIIPLLSDPFGRGWDLSAPPAIASTLPRRRALRLVHGVGAIVAGHVSPSISRTAGDAHSSRRAWRWPRRCR